MIKAKRQAKVISKTPKKSAPHQFSIFRFFSFHLFIGLFIIILASINIITLPQTSSQNAEPVTEDHEYTIFSPSLLPTEAPLPSPVLPLETMQTLNPTPEVTSAASPSGEISPTAIDDFCINVPVVLYHHIQPMEIATLLGHAPLTVDSFIFDDQIKYLKEHGYHASSADDLVQALENRQPLPEKSVIITIDDGYDDNYTYAFLTAKKYEFLMNFMIPTSLINKAGYMNWDHLREMRTSEYARIYNHTASHAPLGLISQAQIDQELATSSAAFKTELGLETNIFTYPYGSYSPLAIQELKKHGFTAAFTTDPGQQECLSSIMQLKRVRVGNAAISSYGF
jgi:peptidoglycan/xylan/chitin deacetylase (PgdA/CDA1 family)